MLALFVNEQAGDKEEPDGPIAVTATHSSKPNTDQYQFPFILGRQGTEYKLNRSNWEYECPNFKFRGHCGHAT